MKRSGIRNFTERSMPAMMPLRRITQLAHTKKAVAIVIPQGECSMLSW